jgi:hypothetical protein
MDWYGQARNRIAREAGGSSFWPRCHRGICGKAFIHHVDDWINGQSISFWFQRKLVDLVANIGEGGPNNDFHPSRLLLSASIRIREAHEENAPTPFHLISREDDSIRRHPWVQGNSPTADWFSRGRSTPGEFSQTKSTTFPLIRYSIEFPLFWPLHAGFHSLRLCSEAIQSRKSSRRKR